MILAFPNGPMRAGQRFALFGRSGSGKTYLSQWAMLLTRKMRWVVLDTKHDPNFDAWHPVTGFLTMDRLHRRWKETERVVIRPHPYQISPEMLDAYISDIHNAFDNFGMCIDETYQVAFGSRAGPGLTGLVTRGRARGQTVILGSQRPAWVPRFVFSEANAYLIMNLNLREDRERVYQMTGKRRVLDRVEPRHWLYYDVTSDALSAFAPVKVSK